MFPNQNRIARTIAAPSCAVAAAFAGLTPTVAAHAAVKPNRAAYSDPLRVSVILTDGARRVRRTRREIGFRATRPASGGGVTLSVDLSDLKAALRRLEPAFHSDPRPARPFLFHGHLKIQPGSEGRALNVATSAEDIAAAAQRSPAARRFMVTEEKHPSPLTAERLRGINGVLGRMTTLASPNPKRCHNIALAVAHIDGALLSPGETFSLNGAVGKRTHETGYLTAPVYVDAEVEPGIGGGVSQVTGTLFNAAARAGLKIVEVHPHSRPVAYLPVGYDATVAYGDEDLKFQNDTRSPVFIDYRFDPKTRRLAATIWGAKAAGKKVRLGAQVRHLGPGKIDAVLYRTIFKSGKPVSRERLFAHHYRWKPKAKA